ncbi:MAG: peptidylprolyl isomerase [Planctomycetes bacterium]|nr:peptidylprolyl isomerase [Planctomycetota bacterium]
MQIRRTLTSTVLSAMVVSTLPTLPAQAQDASRFAATFAGGSVTWNEFHEELARRHRGKQLGKDSLEHLVEKAIVEREAERRGEKVSKEEIDRYLEMLEKQLAAADRSLREHLASRATSLASFRDYIALSRLYERLARADLGLDENTPLDSGRRKLWITEQKRKHTVETDVGKLPQDAAALVDEDPIALADLGLTMARSLVAEERRSILRQMVAYRLLGREAERLGIEITNEHYEKALATKRSEIESSPEYSKHGIDLESLLRAQGRSIADMQRGEVFRAEVLIEAIGRKRFTDDDLKAKLEKDPELWDRRVGASREVHRILLAIGEQRNEEQAIRDAKVLAAKITDAQTFAAAARRFSDDEGSKGRGGRLGWLHREEPGVDEALVAAAFRLEFGKVSEPVRDSDGVSLLLVTQATTGPKDRARLMAMRRYEVGAWLRDLVDRAGIEFHALPVQ